MTQAAFDTLKFVETLEAAGMPMGQAKAISAAVKDSYDAAAADVATRRDVTDLISDFRAKIDKT
ncbi:DUF1640 domain-containing protein, partial [Brenneria populi]|nr:DUF1640 domain-containing protein [Brenneria populi Li et al. 2015]